MAKHKRTKSSQTAGSARPASKPTGPADSRPRFEYLVVALAMAIAVCVLYPELIFQDKIFFGSDSQAATGFATAGRRALAEGTYPLWNPYIFSGMPSYGSLSYNPYVYPVTRILTPLVKYLFFPSMIWLFFHTWLIGFATYLVLRDRRVHWAAGVAAGMLMMWMPNLVAVGAHGHGSQAAASGYLPLAILFWDRIWRGKKTLLNACALAVVLGWSMLRGHLQISYYTYMLVGFHWLFFGIARIVDGTKAKEPKTSPLPRRWLERLRGGAKRFSAREAAAEWGFATVVLAAVVVLSLAISTVLYLPVHDYAQYSIRGASGAGGLEYEYATSWSLHPKEIVTFVLPYSYGFGKDLYYGHMPFTDYPNYLGIVALAFAVLSLFIARSRFVGFLSFVVIVTTVIAFGKHVPILYGPLYKFMPFFSKFRVPVMILIVQQVAVVLMCGIGIDAALRVLPKKGKQVAVVGLAAAFVIFMIVLLSQGFWTGGFAQSIAGGFRQVQDPQQQIQVARIVGSALRDDLTRRFAPMLAGLFVIWFVYFNSRRRSALLAVGLTLLLGMLDFYVINRNILHPESWRHYEPLRIIQDRSIEDRFTVADDVIDFLRKDERPYRVFPMDHPRRPFSQYFQSNRFMAFGISSIGGYHAAKLSWYDEFLRTALPASLRVGRFHLVDMLNARYLISGGELPESQRFRPVWSGVDYQGRQRFIYENAGASPRAFFVDRYRVVTDRDQALDLLATGAVDVTTEAILDQAPPIQPESSEGAVAEVVELGFNRVRIAARAERPCLLVASEVYYPDWKVTIDGEPAKLLRANYILRAVMVPAGEHEVVFEYDAGLIRKGLVISASSMGLTLVVFAGYFLGWLRSRRRGSTDMRSNV